MLAAFDARPPSAPWGAGSRIFVTALISAHVAECIAPSVYSIGLSPVQLNGCLSVGKRPSPSCTCSTVCGCPSQLNVAMLPLVRSVSPAARAATLVLVFPTTPPSSRLSFLSAPPSPAAHPTAASPVLSWTAVRATSPPCACRDGEWVIPILHPPSQPADRRAELALM